MPDTYAVPMLPCADIDEIDAFYRVLGFDRTYRQTRPNPYLALRRGALQLHFFGIEGFDPEQSYGTCGVFVSDTEEIYTEFAAGMRAAYGKILVAGIPRMTRPRKRANVGGVSGFSVIDPGGNWVRFFPHSGDRAEPDHSVRAGESRAARVYRNAVVIADSHGDDGQAAKIIDSTLAKIDQSTPPADLARLVAYRAEIAVRLGDSSGAAAALDRFERIELADHDRRQLDTVIEDVRLFRENLDHDSAGS